MFDLSIDLDKGRTDALLAVLGKLAGNDYKAIHESLGEETLNIIRERFDKSVDSYGVPFAPIKSYIYKNSGAGKVGMRRNAGDPPLKVLTLFRSFSYNADRNSVSIGTPVSYAKYHTDFPKNNGGTRSKIKRREFLGIFQPKDVDRLRKTLLDSLVEMAGA